MAKTNRIRNNTLFHYEQQGGKCFYCDKEVFLGWTVSEEFAAENHYRLATFDHKIPASQGGTYRRDNGVCACRLCNEVRGNMAFKEFKAKATKLIAKRLKSIRRKLRRQRQRRRMFMMNSYIVARFAEQANATVEQLFQQYVEPVHWQEET